MQLIYQFFYFLYIVEFLLILKDILLNIIMTQYGCVVCDHKTDIKTNYLKHMQSAKHLDKIAKKDDKKEEKIDDKEYDCKYCDNTYATLRGYNKHKKTCTQKEEFAIEQALEIQALKKTIEALQNTINSHEKIVLMKDEMKNEIIESKDKIIESKDKEIEYLRSINNTKNKKQIINANTCIDTSVNSNANTCVGTSINTNINNTNTNNDMVNTKPSIYLNQNITNFDDKNVVYIGYVGKYNNELIYKYGISSRIFSRDYNEHRKTFDAFELIYLKETDNNYKIETLFEKELKCRNLHRKLSFKNKNQTELFTIMPDNDIDKLTNMLDKLIETNPLPAILHANNKLKELENNNSTEIKIKEIDYKMTDNYKIELQIKMLELQQNIN